MTLTQQIMGNSYTAYCPYFDERIPFHAENIEGKDLPSTAQFLITWKEDGAPEVVQW